MKTITHCLLAALLVYLSVKLVSAADVYVWKTAPFTRCPLVGGASPGTAKATSNKKKNRWRLPTAGQFDPRVSLSAMLRPGQDENRWNSGKAGRVAGFVAKVTAGGISHGESCNCGARAEIDGDTHIDLVLDRADTNDPSKKIIVEITPRLRELMAAQGIDWKTRRLKRLLEGKWVEFEGWLFFDPDHRTGAVHSDPNDTQIPEENWRASGWEIHPVTAFRVLNGPPAAPSAKRLQKR